MKKPKLACFDNVPPEEVAYFWDELGKSVGEGVPRYDRNHKNIVVADIAEHLGRSPEAVAGLLRRGLRKLPKAMHEPLSNG